MVAPASISKPLRIAAGDLASYYKIFGYYHDGPKDTVAVWGALADRWGLRELTMEQFSQVVAGQALDGSGRSTQTQNGVRTGMIDVVYEPPKSVAELMLRSPPDLRKAIVEAFTESVIEAHRMVHEEAPVARVPVAAPSAVGPRVCVAGARKGKRALTQGSVTARVPGELMSLAPIIEFAARPTAESDERGAPDPHLHAHVPVFAMVAVADEWAPEGVRYLIPDDHGIKTQGAERSDVAITAFGRRLRALGIPLEDHVDRKGRGSWEVAHTTRALRRLLSSNARRAERICREHEERSGRPLSDVELKHRMYATRGTKTAASKAFDFDPDWEAWRDIVSRASGMDLGPYPRLAPIEAAPFAERAAVLRKRALGPEGLCRDDSTFSRSAIRTTLTRLSVDLGFDRAELSRLADELAKELVVVRPASRAAFEYLGTRQLLNRERHIEQMIEAKVAAAAPAPSAEVVERSLAASEKPLDDEQCAAVRAACAPNGWANIEGLAGTGKTTALSAAVTAYRAAGENGSPTADQVIVVCVAAATAERTGRKLKADHWYSVEGFRRAVESGRLSPTERSLVLVDESCMVNTFQEADLLKAAGDAQIVNVGDPGQLTPIGPGGWYGPQADRHGAVFLHQVHRHEDKADEADFTKIHEGRSAEAVAGLARRGRVQVLEGPEDRIGAVVADYARWRNQGRAACEVLTVIDGPTGTSTRSTACSSRCADSVASWVRATWRSPPPTRPAAGGCTPVTW